jgi:hypothetical protein
LLQTLSYTINPSHSKLFIRSFEPFFSGAGAGWIAHWQHGFLHAGLGFLHACVDPAHHPGNISPSVPSALRASPIAESIVRYKISDMSFIVILESICTIVSYKIVLFY